MIGQILFDVFKLTPAHTMCVFGYCRQYSWALWEFIRNWWILLVSEQAFRLLILVIYLSKELWMEPY